MRRGGQSTGGGGGGFSKPPPAPLTHGGAGRVRLHTPEANGGTKDRFGSRERSPSLCSSLPHSPSHPANHSLPPSREKSPNVHPATHSLPGSREISPNVHPAAHSLPGSREKSPNPQGLGDLHDCSMCLSAYIQSLNTVCGTACRLSQCLAQVWTETSVGDIRGNPVRDAADAWEGVARAVGVASAAIKTQMFVLLQEVQARQDLSGEARRQEINKVSQAMLGAFLNLQYQFSAVILERFTLILQNLREDNYTSASVLPPSCPQGNFHETSQISLSNQYNGQNWPPSQGGWTSRGGGGPSPLLESPVKEEKSRSRHSSSGHSVNNQTGATTGGGSAVAGNVPGGSTTTNTATNPSTASQSQPASIQQQTINNQSATVRIPQGPWPNSSPNGNNYINAMNNANYQSNMSVNGLSCSSSNNTLSPGSCYGLFPQGSTSGNMGMWNSDAISRRWSMGGPGSAPEGWSDRCHPSVGIGPFSLIGNRRWSVPEASEHDLDGMTESDLNDLYNSNMVPGEWGGTASSWGSQRGIYVPSRDSSITRSPSHSRSVTPDPNRQSNNSAFISNEELQDVIDLLSLPIFADGPEINGGQTNVINQRETASPRSVSPSSHPTVTQLFDEANKIQQQQYSHQKVQNAINSSLQNQQDQQKQQNYPASPVSQQAKQQQQQGQMYSQPFSQVHIQQQQLQQVILQQQQLQQQAAQQQSQCFPTIQQQQQHQQLYQQHQQFQQQVTTAGDGISQQTTTSAGTATPAVAAGVGISSTTSVCVPLGDATAASGAGAGPVVVDTSDTASSLAHSTPLWPPTGIAPGVTLTQCTTMEEKTEEPTWPTAVDNVGCERRRTSSTTSVPRDSQHRASWPASATLLWAGLDGFLSESEGEEQTPIGLPQYRRHSTDTSHLYNESINTPNRINKTRSSDNIPVVHEVESCKGGGGGMIDSNLQKLLLLNSLLPSSTPATPTSHYSLFTS